MLIRLSALNDKMHRKLRSLGIPEEIADYVSDDKNGFPMATKKFVAKYLADKMASESMESWPDFESKHSHDLVSVRDWLKHARGEDGSDLNMHLYKSWDDMVSAATAWHEWLAEKMASKGHVLLYRDADAENVVMSFPDGYNIFDVSERDCKNEGALMGHCVGGYADSVASGECKIYSLRDENGEPHVTWEVKSKVNGEPYAVQVQGKEDKPPTDKYRPYLWEFFARNPEIDTKRVSGRIVFVDGLLQKMEETGLWTLKDINLYDLAQEDQDRIGKAFASKVEADPTMIPKSDPKLLRLALRNIPPENKEKLLEYLPISLWPQIVDSRRFAEELVKRAPSTPHLLTSDYIDEESLERAFGTMSPEEILVIAETQGWSEIHRSMRHRGNGVSSKENFAEAFAADFLKHPSILIGQDPRHPIRKTRLREVYDEEDGYRDEVVEEGEEGYEDAYEDPHMYNDEQLRLQRPDRYTSHAGIRLLLKKGLITPENFPHIALETNWDILDFLETDDPDYEYEKRIPLFEGFARMLEETPELISPEILDPKAGEQRSKFANFWWVFGRQAENYALSRGGQAAELVLEIMERNPELGFALTQPDYREQEFPRWEDPIYGASSRIYDLRVLSQLEDPEAVNDLFGDQDHLATVLPNFIKMGGQYAEKVYDSLFAGNWWLYDTLTGQEDVRNQVLERFVRESLKNPSLLEEAEPFLVNQAMDLMRKTPGKLSEEFFRTMMDSGEMDETIFGGRATNFGRFPEDWGKKMYRSLPGDLANGKILERIEMADTPAKLFVYVNAIPLPLWNSEWTPLLMGPILNKYMGFRRALDTWDENSSHRWEFASGVSKLREAISNAVSSALVRPDVPPERLALGLKTIFDLEGKERSADISNPSRAPFHILDVAQNNPELLSEAARFLPSREYAEGLSEMISPDSIKARQNALRFKVRSWSEQTSDYMAGENSLNRELLHVPVEGTAHPYAQRAITKHDEFADDEPDERQMRMDLSASTRGKVIRLSHLLDIEGLHHISDRIERILC